MGIDNTVIKKSEDPLAFDDGLSTLQSVQKQFPSENLKSSIAQAKESGTLDSDLYRDALDTNETGTLDLDDDFAQNAYIFHDINLFLTRHMPELTAEYSNDDTAQLPENVDTGYITELRKLNIRTAAEIENLDQKTFIANLCASIPAEGTLDELFGAKGDIRYTLITDFGVDNNNQPVVVLKDNTPRTITPNTNNASAAADMDTLFSNTIDSVPFDPKHDLVKLVTAYERIEQDAPSPEDKRSMLIASGLAAAGAAWEYRSSVKLAISSSALGQYQAGLRAALQATIAFENAGVEFSAANAVFRQALSIARPAAPTFIETYLTASRPLLSAIGFRTLALRLGAAALLVYAGYELYNYLTTEECEGNLCNVLEIYNTNREVLQEFALTPATFEKLILNNNMVADQPIKYLWWYANIHGYVDPTEDVVAKMVNANWRVLYHAGPEYARDPQLVKLAAKQNPLALLHAPEEVLQDTQFLKTVLGDQLPKDYADNPGEWIRNLQTVSQIPERFSSLATVDKLWRQSPDNNHPLAAVINGTADHNLSGIMQSDGYIIDLLNHGYHVSYHEVGTESEYATALDKATDKGNKKIEVLFTYGHGNGKTIALSGKDLRVAQSLSYNEKNYLDVSDLNYDQNWKQKGDADPWLIALFSYLDPKAVIILHTCLSGTDQDITTEEAIPVNVKKMFQIVSGKEVTILGTIGLDYGFDRLVFSNDNHITDVAWNEDENGEPVEEYIVQGTYPDWPN